jgi:hypothetical protein
LFDPSLNQGVTGKKSKYARKTLFGLFYRILRNRSIAHPKIRVREHELPVKAPKTVSGRLLKIYIVILKLSP